MQMAEQKHKMNPSPNGAIGFAEKKKYITNLGTGWPLGFLLVRVFLWV